MTIERPADIHEAVAIAFNANDLDAIMALYEDGAAMVGMDGTTVRQMSLTTRYAIEVDDLALLSNDDTVQVGDDTVSGSTAEVVRRQADGSWRYIIDHPTGAGAVPDLPDLPEASA